MTTPARTGERGQRARHDPRLMCGVRRLAYDFDARAGEVHFPAGHCCDMDGCVALFAAIDPEVRLIRTFAGGEPDTIYRKGAGDSPGWTAFDPGGQ